MKKTYEKPQMHAIRLQNQGQLLSGSYNVNGFHRGSDISIGDDDELGS